MPSEFADEFAAGRGTLGSPNVDEIFVTSGDKLKNVNTPEGAQEKLSLFSDAEGTIPNTSGDVIVEFRLNDPTSAGIRTPIETTPPREYGFEQGGTTQGEIPEWNINNGTADDLGATDISIRPLDGKSPEIKENKINSSSTQVIRDNSGDKPVLDNDMSKVGSNTPTNMVKSNHSQGETDDFYNRVENGNELSSLNGTMTDIETRDWYHGELDNIDIVEQQMRLQGRS